MTPTAIDRIVARYGRRYEGWATWCYPSGSLVDPMPHWRAELARDAEPPNVFGIGTTEEEAVAALLRAIADARFIHP